MTQETVELELTLEAIRQTCGYDFRQYARPSLCRRLAVLRERSGLTHVADMIPKILHDAKFLEQVLRTLSITVTEMFRDPSFYLALRREVVPALKALPVIKVWHAGCATGEEVYSLAVLLNEEGLYDRARIYATDFNGNALHTAREGIYSINAIKKGTANYRAAGGHGSLADYYHAEYGSAKMQDSLKKNITFAHHDLATEGPFGEMDLILCRNVMIYFDKALKQRVFSLFADSLHPEGVLCLGKRETLDYSNVREGFEEIATQEKVYRKMASVPRMIMAKGVLV